MTYFRDEGHFDSLPWTVYFHLSIWILPRRIFVSDHRYVRYILFKDFFVILPSLTHFFGTMFYLAILGWNNFQTYDQKWIITSTVRPWDARFLGNGKTCVARNSCNLSYLIRQRQDHQKTVQLQGPCCLRPCSLMPYCTAFHLQNGKSDSWYCSTKTWTGLYIIPIVVVYHLG